MDSTERNSFARTFQSNQSYIYYYFTLQLGSFVIFPCITYKLKEKVGGSFGGGGGGGGGKGYVAPPLKLLGGLPLPPVPSPMKH